MAAKEVEGVPVCENAFGIRPKLKQQWCSGRCISLLFSWAGGGDIGNVGIRAVDWDAAACRLHVGAVANRRGLLIGEYVEYMYLLWYCGGGGRCKRERPGSVAPSFPHSLDFTCMHTVPYRMYKTHWYWWICKTGLKGGGCGGEKGRVSAVFRARFPLGRFAWCIQGSRWMNAPSRPIANPVFSYTEEKFLAFVFFILFGWRYWAMEGRELDEFFSDGWFYETRKTRRIMYFPCRL